MNETDDRFRYLTFIGEGAPTPAPGAATVRAAGAPHGPEIDATSNRFFEILCSRWGLAADRYRNSIFARRQAACLRAIRVSTPVEGARLIDHDAAASERALAAVMIGVTEFFRDPAVFEELRPLLRPLQTSKPFTALSLGCSDGSELYSLAMLMAEEGLLAGACLRGIDCRPAAVNAAREGIYAAAATAVVPAALRTRYFEPLPETPRSHAGCGGVRVSHALRAVCRWTNADAFSLSTEPNPADMCDLILCRNLAIYLTPEASAELWGRCLANLKPGGVLVVGKAERPPPHVRSRLSRLSACIYRRD